MKKLLSFLIVIAPIVGFTQSIQPYRGQTEDPAYLLSLHGCTDEGIRSGNMAIPRTPSGMALILPPSRYQYLNEVAAKAAKEVLTADPQFQRAIAKAAEFKNSGNVAAKDDWLATALERKNALTKQIGASVYSGYAQRIIDNENLPTYFATLATAKLKTSSLDTLIAATGDRCWISDQGN
jgi:hypothetical protein